MEFTLASMAEPAQAKTSASRTASHGAVGLDPEKERPDLVVSAREGDHL